MSRPFLLGLTGSIAMGKSTVAKQFAAQGIPSLHSDEVVHRLYAHGGKAVDPIRQLIPSAIVNGSVSRPLLSQALLANPSLFAALEPIVHPLVQAEEEAYAHRMARLGHRLLVFDIPLLYETGADARMDAVAVVTAPAFIQKQRAMRRPGMTEEKLRSILNRQLPDVEKRLRADFIIPTSLGKAYSWRIVQQIIQQIHRHDA